jgi:DNA modification methylase
MHLIDKDIILLDPFLGTGATSQAALLTGRNSIGNEIEPAYFEIAYTKLPALSHKKRHAGAVRNSVWRISF